MKILNFKFIALFIFLSAFKLSAATYYWVGGSGDWSQYNLHWATTSGGLVFYSQVPTLADDVVFDANSFTATSRTVTINSGTAFCRNMNWLAATYTPTFDVVNTNQNPFPELRIAGSLTLSPSMHFLFYGPISMVATTLGNTIRSNGNAINNLTLNGVGGEWTLQDSLGVYQDLNFAKGTLRTNNFPVSFWHFVTSGTGKSLYLGTSRVWGTEWNASSGSFTNFDGLNATLYVDKVTMGASQWYGKINVRTSGTGTISGASNSRVNKVTVASNTTTMQFFGVTKVFSFDAICNTEASGTTFGKLIVRKNYTESGACSFDTLMLRNNNYSALLYPLGGHQIYYYMDALSSNPCEFITLGSTNPTLSVSIAKTGGVVNCSNLNLSHITASGTATFNATNSIAGANVVGWNVTGPAPRTLYWVGGTGNWSSLSHWSNSSGGPANQCILPTGVDNIIFDNNSLPSGAQVLLDLTTINVNNITWSGYTGSRTFTIPTSAADVNLTVNGDWQMNSVVSWQVPGTIRFSASTTGHTIKSNGAALTKLIFDVATGGWSLLDPLTCATLTVNRGFFDTQGYSVTGTTMTVNNYAANNIELRTSTLNIGSLNLYANSTSTSIDADSVVFNCNNIAFTKLTLHQFIVIPGSAELTFCHLDSLRLTGSGQVIGNSSTIAYLHFTGNGSIDTYNQISWLRADKNLNILSNSNLGTLQLNNPGYTVSVQIGAYIDISGTILTTTGACGSYITLTSNTPGNTARFVKSSGTINCTGMIIRDIIAQGGATFNAYQSIGQSITTGWNIYSGSAGATHYWVGGPGNWNNPLHWSLTSGGVGGACIPSLNDDVVFNAASLSGTDIVQVSDLVIYCKSMTWSGITGTPQFQYTGAAQPHEIQISGSVQLPATVNWTYNGTLHLVGSGQSKSVDFGGHYIGDLLFDGLGSHWSLQDSINAGTLKMTHGKLSTNSHLLRVTHMLPYGDTLVLDSSLVISTEWQAVDQTNQNILLLPSNHSTIIAGDFRSLPAQYNKVWGVNFMRAKGCHIREFISDPTASMLQMDDNIFNTGSRDTIDHAVINSYLLMNATGFRFGHLELTNNATLNTSFYADTLWFNNPGGSVTLHKDSTISIGQEMFFSSNASSPITFNSSVSGSAAYLSKTTDTICAEYLLLKDIHATGGADFYAGMYSVNNGNNTGWLFQTCTPPIDDVWPGDVNKDLVVDNLDALYIGIAFGTSSYSRPGADLSWTAQPCLDWPYVYTNLVNVKNADCDGNGLVDSLDLAGVALNYGMTRPPLASPLHVQHVLSAGVPLFFQPTNSHYDQGDTVIIPFHLGSTGSPVSNAYGIACDLDYDNSRIVPGSLNFSLGNSWLAPSSNRLEYIYDNAPSNRIEFSDSRIDQQNVSGQGQIGIISFIIDTNATDSIQLNFSNIHLLDVSQNEIPVSPLPLTIYINQSQSVPVVAFTSTPSSICEGGSIAFTDQSGNTPTSWLWTFTGGTPSTSTLQNPTVTYSTAGSHPVSLTATNANGSSTGPVQYVTVISSVLPTPGAITGTNNLCNAVAATYSIPAVSGATTYTWSVPTGMTITSGQGTLSISVSISGLFTSGTVSVVASSTCGSSPAATRAVSRAASAPATISGPSTNICTATAVYWCSTVAGATSYTWTVPTGVTITAGQNTTSIQVSFQSAFASGNIMVYATNACGSSANTSLNIIRIPATPGVISGPATNICSTTETYSIAPVAGASNYTWTVPSGVTIVSGQNTTALTVSFTTTFATGAITVKAGNICPRYSATRSLTLIRIPAQPVSITGPSTNFCATTATYSTAPVNGASTYNWTVPTDVTIISGQGTTSINVSFAPSFVSGDIKVKAGSSCPVYSAVRLLTVSRATAAPSAISGPGANLCSSSTVNYSVVNDSGMTYTWTVPAGLTILSGNGTNAISVAVGTFTSGTVSVVASNGCTTSTAVTKAVKKAPPTPGVISGPSTNVCAATGTYSVPAVAGAVSYTWTVPATVTITSGQGTNTIQVAYASNFVSGTVTVTATNACPAVSAASSLYINKKPATPGAITGRTSAVCGLTAVPYSVAAVAGAVSYTWTVPAGSTITSGQGTNSILVDFGNTVTSGTVNVYASNTCSNSASRSLALGNCNISGNRMEAITQGDSLTVSNIYPNPANNKFFLDIESSGNCVIEMELYDAQGKLIATEQKTLVQGSNTISNDAEFASKGIFLVRIVTSEGRSIIKRVIIQ